MTVLKMLQNIKPEAFLLQPKIATKLENPALAAVSARRADGIA
jgi:hypothetical protein